MHQNFFFAPCIHTIIYNPHTFRYKGVITSNSNVSSTGSVFFQIKIIINNPVINVRTEFCTES